MKICSDNTIEFDSDDTFSLDITLNGIIKNALIAFKQSKRYGVPPSFLKDPNSYTQEDFDNAILEWDKILDEMIYAFSIDDPTDIEFENSPYDYSLSWVDENNIFTPRYKDGITDTDIEAYEAERSSKIKTIKDRVNNGRQLFIKYYDNLWI